VVSSSELTLPPYAAAIDMYQVLITRILVVARFDEFGCVIAKAIFYVTVPLTKVVKSFS
jgi:hypothetical protein